MARLRAPPQLRPPPGVDRLGAAFAYDGPGRAMITALKYRRDRSVERWLVAALVSAAPPGPFDAVTWVPTTDIRRRERGFDQSRRLAQGLAGRLGLPARRLLMRTPGPAQTGLDRAARRAGPALVARPAPTRVLLVDDVCTTGATLREAATALRGAGASAVASVVLARTPRLRADHCGTVHFTPLGDISEVRCASE